MPILDAKPDSCTDAQALQDPPKKHKGYLTREAQIPLGHAYF